MKTAYEFYKEIVGSKELQEELKNTSCEMLGVFLKKHDCMADAKEFKALVSAQCEGEIADEEAGNASGGYMVDSWHSRIDTKTPI
ncbi:MAG: hypothetical protein IK057_04675 [Clostridia bacterium]|nr:hypothetical protein [Clostridia bacterium]